MNANQLFYWRKLYHAGQLGGGEKRSAESSVRLLLPVSVGSDEPCAVKPEQGKSAALCVTMNIEIPGRALVSLLRRHGYRLRQKGHRLVPGFKELGFKPGSAVQLGRRTRGNPR